MSWENMGDNTDKKKYIVRVMIALIVFVLGRGVVRGQATKSLFFAVRKEEIEEVNRLIQKGANVNAITISNESIPVTPLTLAAMINQEPEILRTLIENGADVNPTGVVGTPLLWAARRNPDPEFLRILIENGADLNPSEYSRTPLMDAAEENSNPEILRVLIENGADVNAVDRNGLTSLIFAASRWRSSPEILRFLLENGAEVAIKDNFGLRALDYAEKDGALEKTDAYKLLREKTIENLKNATEILLALAKSASVEETTRLIQEGADVNAVNDYRERTVLMRTAGYGFALLDLGRKVSWNRWERANEVGYNPVPEVLRILIENGADVNATDEEGLTSLTLAAMNNSNPEALRILIENGANVAIVDKYGRTALDYAGENNALKGTDAYDLLREQTLSQTEFFESPARRRYRATNELLFFAGDASIEKIIDLIHEGADVNAVDDSVTSLMFAAESNSNPDVLLALIENGADVNAVSSSYGFFASTIVAHRNKSEVLRILGVDTNALIRDNKTPLWFASESTNNPDVRRLLESKMGGERRYEKLWKDWTPLMFAAAYNSNPENLHILIEKGAEVNCVDGNGKKALDYAEENESLKETGALNFLREKTLSEAK